jgi:choloylglycine hydrolase
MVYYFDDSLPIAVLTNERYSECLSNWRRRLIPDDDPYVSNRRFSDGVRALAAGKDLLPEQHIELSFEVLDKMSQHPCTQWNVVFDVTNRTIYFRTKVASNVRYIRLTELDFSCRSIMQQLDVNENYSGNVRSRLVAYSRERNLNLMKNTFKTLGIQRTDEQMSQLVDFFEGFQCAE